MSSLSCRRAARRPVLSDKLRQMALSLAPLVQVDTGRVHPAFPATLMHFWLLTDDQLDDLAHFYHQRTPSFWSRHYPCPVTWLPGLALEEKRRKIGKFIGLRGCETPVDPTAGPEETGDANTDTDTDTNMTGMVARRPSDATRQRWIGDRHPSCRGRCAWDTMMSWSGPTSYYCLACARRVVAGMLNGQPVQPQQQQQQRSDPIRDPPSPKTPTANRSHRAYRSARESRPRPPTVEDIIEDARRARLASSEEAMRHKLWFYR